jgi:triosephosphate isomerase
MTSRIPIVAGNWKMNTTAIEALALLEGMLPGLVSVPEVERVVCPPFVSLAVMAPRLAGTGIGLGAQTMHWEDAGAFTGEVSPLMIKPLCSHVILGHSERRAYFGETDGTVNKRVQAALRHDLAPIVCVGETLAENEAGRTAEVVRRQVREGLAGLTAAQGTRLVVAYEPVWAIGTGRAATPEGANAVVGGVIRSSLGELFGAETAAAIRIQYGGSVTAANAAAFFSQPDIDGALVGGASLKPNEFLQIVTAARA